MLLYYVSIGLWHDERKMLMKIKNLKEGMIVKNYKELCKILEIKEATSNSKKAQLKDLDMYAKYKKEGHKFIIEEIYPRAKDREDGRVSGNNSVYKNDIEILIMDMLSKRGKKIDMISIGSLLKATSIVSSRYSRRWFDKCRIHEEINIPIDYINDFYDITQSTLKRHVETALRSLRSKALVIWHEDIAIAFKDGKHKKSDEDQKKAILDAERNIMDYMGLDDRQHVFLSGKWDRFKMYVEMILDHEIDLDYYYNVYSIAYNKDTVVETVGKEKLKRTQRQLNENITTQLKLSNDTRHETAQAKVKKGVHPLSINNIRSRFDYVVKSNRLVDIIVDIEVKQ